jgi:4-amino-4-deoxy-L-arabinose transferase-like glycosyltransferase
VGSGRPRKLRDQVATVSSKADAAGALRQEGPSHVWDRFAASRRAGWLAPAAIVLLGVVCRVAVVAADTDYAPRNDAREYHLIAESIAAGDEYPSSAYLLYGGPTAIRPPAYPSVLAMAYAMPGDDLAAGRALGIGLGVLLVVLVYLVARRIWGRSVALAAGCLTAVFPPLVLLSRDLVSESLFIALELGAVLCVLNARRAGGAPGWAAAAGALAGLAALTRSTGLLLVVVLALGAWVGRPRWQLGVLRAPAILVACAALVIAPWTVRNAAEFGRFIPVSTSSGIALAGTYNEDSHSDSGTHGAWRTPQTVPRFEPLFVTPGIDEGTVDATLRREARDFAWSHPGYVAETTGWNLLRLFAVTGGSVVDNRGRVVDDRGIGSAISPAERIGLAMVAILAAAGIAGIVQSRRGPVGDRRIPAGSRFLWAVPIVMVMVAAPVAGLPRYRLPADPFLLILAGIGVVWLWSRLRAPRRVVA